MSRGSLFLLTTDETVLSRFRPLADSWVIQRLTAPGNLSGLSAGSLAVVDSAHPLLPPLTDHRWRTWCGHLSVVLVSSDPHDEQGLAAFEAGVSGYCHAYSSELTLRQVMGVVSNGELWVGRSLLGRLLRGVDKASAASGLGGNSGGNSDGNSSGQLTAHSGNKSLGWSNGLTEREREVAQLAALGESNLSIAEALGITERTVKSHLTAVFEKLHVADRLQLALKVHGVK